MSDDGSAEGRFTGGCDCRAVRYEVEGRLRAVVNCHCGQCRRTHGHYAPYTNAAMADFRLVEERGLRWYESSDTARRGFCGECGSSLFWQRDGGQGISIAAGTLDGPTGLVTVANIFMDDAGDYYEVHDGLPTWPGTMGGAVT